MNEIFYYRYYIYTLLYLHILSITYYYTILYDILYRKLEESHDWLCSLADNAITASQCEGVLKSLYTGLDTEKQRGIKSLVNTLNISNYIYNGLFINSFNSYNVTSYVCNNNLYCDL